MTHTHTQRRTEACRSVISSVLLLLFVLPLPQLLQLFQVRAVLFRWSSRLRAERCCRESSGGRVCVLRLCGPQVRAVQECRTLRVSGVEVQILLQPGKLVLLRNHVSTTQASSSATEDSLVIAMLTSLSPSLFSLVLCSHYCEPCHSDNPMEKVRRKREGFKQCAGSVTRADTCESAVLSPPGAHCCLCSISCVCLCFSYQMCPTKKEKHAPNGAEAECEVRAQREKASWPTPSGLG